jgi:ubiquinol-cytochrome c reductase iron-sulfur subunit
MASAAAIENPSRRDFLFLATGAVGALGVAAVAWPLIDQMNPDASTLALSSIEVDLGAIPEGQIVTVKWRGGPVFVRHRTKKEIEEAQNINISELRDPQTDAQRVQRPAMKASTRAGFARATARCTTHRVEFGRVRPPSISPSPSTSSSAIRR